MIKLSILDQSPISKGQTAEEALKATVRLAQVGEEYGYTRFWIAEHHDIEGFACPAPEIMIPYIALHTNSIRVGSGAVLLPHYKPFKVAEQFHLLSTLFPNRIDLGIGRAPGGSAEASLALSDNFLKNVGNMPNLVEELLFYLYHKDRSLEKPLLASPIPETPPTLWLLGTGKKSAHLAAEKGLPYAFGHFMSSDNGQEIIDRYITEFKPQQDRKKPYVIVAVSVVCAETNEKAEQLASSWFLWHILMKKMHGEAVPTIEEAMNYPFKKKEKESINRLKKKIIVGDPPTVKQKLLEIKEMFSADELMIVTITHSERDKQKSYELIGEQFHLKGS